MLNDEAATFRAFRDRCRHRVTRGKVTKRQTAEIYPRRPSRKAPADCRQVCHGPGHQSHAAGLRDNRARIINHFTSQSIPILTIHDSYIVNEGCEHELDRVMKTAFEEVTGVRGAQLKWENRTSREIIEEQFARRSMDMRNPAFRANLQIALEERSRVPRTDRYKNNYQQFKQMSVSEK